MGAWVISFAGFAALYGALGCLIILGLSQAIGRFVGWRSLPFLFVTLTFVMLTQHPFPDPATLSCPVATAVPQLAPFQARAAISTLIEQDAPWLAWAQNRIIAATAMNFFICFGIGLCLPASLRPLPRAALFGAALTSLVELSQLSGIAGLYPCAYRQFNVDDLLMNFLGVLSGAFCIGIWALLRPNQSKSGEI